MMFPFRCRAPFARLMAAVRCTAAALVVATTLATSGTARATSTYSITLQGSSQTSATPLRQSYWTATPGVAPTIINETASAAPGAVGSYAKLETAWPFDLQINFSGHSGAQAATDDFLIAGPHGVTSVQGAMLFRTKVRLDHSGGLAGSDQHRAKALLHVAAAQLQADGSGWLGNLTAGSDGVLAGHAPPEIDVTFSLSGAFPVGVPFAVSMDFECENSTFGDSTVSPGITETDGLEMGLSLGDANGHAMELPPGYTVNSRDWHVAANVTGVVDDADIDPTGPRLAPAAPNPSRGNTVLAFSLPRPGEVSLVVTDLQGRVVRLLPAGWLSAGHHDLVWDGRRDSGERAASGVYFAVVRFEDRVLTRRLERVR